MTTLEAGPSPGTKSRYFYGYLVVVAAFFVMAAMWAAYFSFGVFLKPIAGEFGWTRATISSAFSISAIVNGLLAIAMGRLTDRFGPRMVITICAVVLWSGFLLMSRISAVWQLYLFYGIIVGTGMGGSFVPLMSTVARWFVDKRSLMTGIVTAGAGIGALLGPPLANHFISIYGWRRAYAILSVAVLATVVLFASFIKRDPAEVGQLAHGEMEIGNQPEENTPIKALSFRESIYTGQFWVIFVMFFCLGFCTYAIMVHMAPHSTEQGISAAGAANILATVGALSIVGRVVLGRVADIAGSQRMFAVGLILMSAALFGLIPAKMVAVLYILAGVFGLGYGACVASQSPLVAVLFGLKSHGAILGFLSFGFTTGGAVGPLSMGYIFDVAGTYRIAFLLCSVISTIAVVLSFSLKSTRSSLT